MAGLTSRLLPSKVTWERKVILMPSLYYCYIVTSETGVRWAGVTPLGRSQAHRGVKAQALKSNPPHLPPPRKHTLTHSKACILRFTPITHPHMQTHCLFLSFFLFSRVHELTPASLRHTHTHTHTQPPLHREHNSHHCPCGKHSANTSHKNKQVD